MARALPLSGLTPNLTTFGPQGGDWRASAGAEAKLNAGGEESIRASSLLVEGKSDGQASDVMHILGQGTQVEEIGQLQWIEGGCMRCTTWSVPSPYSSHHGCQNLNMLMFYGP